MSNKTLSFSISPAIKQKNIELQKITFSKAVENTGNLKIRLSESMSKIGNRIKIGQHFYKGTNHSQIDIDEDARQIEGVLKKNLRKEHDILKKTEIVLETFEKLSGLNRSFFIFHSVLEEFLSQVKSKLIWSYEKEEAFKEIKEKFDYQLLKQKETFASIEVYKHEHLKLKEEIERLKTSQKILKNTCKKQLGLLNRMKESGYPIEQIYESTKSSVKSKSVNNVLKGNIERPVSLSTKGILIPKLKLPLNENNEGYQEEFMAKFEEFSESWRNQIAKDHHILNK